MLVFWFVLFWGTLFIIVSEKKSRVITLITKENVRMKSKNPNKIFFYISLGILVIISGLRSGIGDTGYYMYSYKIITNNFYDVFNYRDVGFYLIVFFLKKLISHPQILILLSAAVTNFLIMKTLYKKSPYLFLSVFFYIAGGFYLATMNGLRQFIVAAIFFRIHSLIIENKKKEFFVIILLLSMIHSSIIIMFPVYYIVKEKAWSAKIYFLIIMSLIGVLSFNSIFNTFSEVIQYTQYGHYIKTFGTQAYSGTNPLRIIFNGIPVILGYLYRKKLIIKEKNYNIYMNLSLMNFIFYIFSSFNWIFARFGIYFGLFNLILIPKIIKYCFNKDEKIIIKFLFIIFYLIFYYFEINSKIYMSYYLNINREYIGNLTKGFYF